MPMPVPWSPNRFSASPVSAGAGEDPPGPRTGPVESQYMPGRWFSLAEFAAISPAASA